MSTETPTEMPMPARGNPLVQLELALHDADCTTPHDALFRGHGDKYSRLALAAVAVMPPERDPWWLRDVRQMIELVGNKVCEIETKLDKLSTRMIGE